jgi:hypothetical protein
MAVFAAGAIAHVDHPLGTHRELAGGPGELPLLVGIAFALPSDQDAALAEQWGRKLGESREAAHGAGGDHVVRLSLLSGGKLLRAGVEDGCVGDPSDVDRPLDELALTANGLDQVNPRAG